MANKDSDVYKNLVRIEEPEARIHVDAPDGVLPLALNVELPGGYVSEAVPSGVRLPHTATAMFSTADSFQLAAEFHILMGNRPLACDNIPLCRIRVRNIKWSGAGVPQIELRFDIDEAGMLTVSAANLDRSNAEIVVFTAGDEVAHDDVWPTRTSIRPTTRPRATSSRRCSIATRSSARRTTITARRRRRWGTARKARTSRPASAWNRP